MQLSQKPPLSYVIDIHPVRSLQHTYLLHVFLNGVQNVRYYSNRENKRQPKLTINCEHKHYPKLLTNRKHKYQQKLNAPEWRACATLISSYPKPRHLHVPSIKISQVTNHRYILPVSKPVDVLFVQDHCLIFTWPFAPNQKEKNANRKLIVNQAKNVNCEHKHYPNFNQSQI